MRKRMALVMSLLVIMSVTGCGRKEIEYVEGNHLASDTDSNSDTDNGEDTEPGAFSGSLAEQIGAPERWDEEYEGNHSGMTGIDVTTDVNLDGISNVNVYHTESMKLTEEYKRNFAEKLSEGVIYKYDDDMKPKAYWEDLIEYQENEIVSVENMNNAEPGMFEMVQNYNINICTEALDNSETNQTDGCGVLLFRCMDGVYLCGEEYESETVLTDSSFSDDVYVEMNRDRIERIELVYCIYSEKEGAHNFMVVPAWRFYSYRNKADYQYEIMVNAIDGSRIDISEN